MSAVSKKVTPASSAARDDAGGVVGADAPAEVVAAEADGGDAERADGAGVHGRGGAGWARGCARGA
jgi:hypothetical protein